MPIEFHCPYCTAAIRVADRAAGKRGKCPKCETVVIVPVLDAFRESRSGAGEHTRRTPESFETAPPDSVAARVRRRQRRGKNWFVPILFGGLLLGALVVYYREPAVKLEGELEAIPLDDPALPPVTIDASLFEVNAEDRDFVLQDLANTPQLLRSPGFMDVEFRGTPEGLEIRVFGSPRTEFVAVNLSQDERLWDYVRRHATELDEPRRQEMKDALQKFASDWANARRNNPLGVIRDMLQYRNEIGLNATLGGIGYHVQAVVGGRTYRCVYQQDTRLYFLLPQGTDSFVLRGRRIQDREPKFPGTYRVDVVRTEDSPAAKEPADDTSTEASDNANGNANGESVGEDAESAPPDAR